VSGEKKQLLKRRSGKKGGGRCRCEKAGLLSERQLKRKGCSQGKTFAADGEGCPRNIKQGSWEGGSIPR